MLGLVIFSIVFLAVFVGYTIKRVLPISKYLYASARASVKSAECLDQTDYEKFAKAEDLEEFFGMLRETPYKDCNRCNNSKEFHIFLEKEYISAIEDIGMETPEEFKNIVKAYLMKFEAKNIKLLMKSKLRDMTVSEELLVPAGEIDQDFIKKLKKAKTIEDMAVILDETESSTLFRKEFWKNKGWKEIEMTIDGYVDRELREAVEDADIPQGEELKECWKEQIIVNDLLLLIRAKLRGVPIEKQKEFVENFGLEEVEALVEKDLEELTPEDLPVNEFIVGKEEEIRAGNVVELEKSIDHYIYEKAQELERINPEGAYPIFAYLMDKKREKNMLQMISKAIEEGVPKEKRLEMTK